MRGVASRALKVRLYELSPFRETLFLDTDIRILRRLDGVWKYLSGNAIGMSLDCFETLGICGSLNRDFVGQEESVYTSQNFPHDSPHYNTGVIVWKRSPEAELLFQTWQKEWERFRGRDQFAMLRAVALSRCPITSLPRKYNDFLPHYLIRFNTVIFHYWAYKDIELSAEARRREAWRSAKELATRLPFKLLAESLMSISVKLFPLSLAWFARVDRIRRSNVFARLQYEKGREKERL